MEWNGLNKLSPYKKGSKACALPLQKRNVGVRFIEPVRCGMELSQGVQSSVTVLWRRLMGKIIKIDFRKPERKKIEEAVRVVRRGGLVIFPTDTVYGLGASIRFPRAIRKIYRIKKRSGKKPLVFLIGHKKDIRKFTNRISNEVKKLIRDFWPGPLTLIFPSKKYKTIALRMPDYRIALGLIRGAGPLAVTSANLSGKKENVTLEGVENQLLQKADLCIDGGKSPLGRVSTLLDVTNHPFKVVREGCIKEKELREAIRDKD